MNRIKIIYFFFGIHSLLIFPLFVKGQVGNKEIPNYEYKEGELMYSKIMKIVKEGDIFLRNGVGKESDLIRKFAIKDSIYTHVGILLRDSFGNYRITHIMGGVSNPKGTILQESISDFISEKGNDGFAIYRLKIGKRQLNKLKKYVDSLIRLKVTFDYKFSLKSQDSLYCTEFIINGFNYVLSGRKIFRPVTKDISLMSAKYFLNTDCLVYYPIDLFTSSKFCKKIISEKYNDY